MLSMLLAASGVAEAATGQARASLAVASATTGTFGKTTVGAKTDNAMFADYKIVHSATLAVSGSITKLSVYAIPGVKSPSPQALKAVIYSDSGGSPGTLLASGTEVTYRGNVNARGWLDLAFASPVALAPGTYWIGFITGSESKGMGYVYDVASGSRAYNPDTYVSGATAVFGALSRDSEQASIYATYTQTASPSPPSAPISARAEVAASASWRGR